MKVKEYLKEKVQTSGFLPKNGDHDKLLPKTLEDARFHAIQDVVNDEVATFLRAILDSYVSMLIVLEEKTEKERLGKKIPPRFIFFEGTHTL